MNVKDWKKKEAPVVARVREVGKGLFSPTPGPTFETNGVPTQNGALIDALRNESDRLNRVSAALLNAALAIKNGDVGGMETFGPLIEMQPVGSAPHTAIPEAFQGKITKRGKALASVYNYLVKNGPSRVADVQKGSGTKTLGTTYQLLYRLAKDKLAEKVYIDKQLHYQAK